MQTMVLQQRLSHATDNLFFFFVLLQVSMVTKYRRYKIMFHVDNVWKR